MPLALRAGSLSESSEQGMFSQVGRAVKNQEWIVYLGWAPHPMNADIDMAYLAGGDDYFGPDFGGATVYTVRKGYGEECPKIGTLLKNLEFSLAMENEVMGLILSDDMEPDKAAKKWLIQIRRSWLYGWMVLTLSTENRDLRLFVRRWVCKGTLFFRCRNGSRTSRPSL